MAINTDMVGQTFGPFVRDYTFRDLELFALGCGAGIDGKDGLEYLNEHDERDPQLKVLPMFGAMLIVDSEVTRTIDYGYNYAGSLHWGFDITFHRPITKMNDHLETKVRLEGLYDRGEGRGLLAQHIGDTYDSDGNLLFTNESWDCLIYDGGWGGPKPPKDIVEMPDRPRTWRSKRRSRRTRRSSTGSRATTIPSTSTGTTPPRTANRVRSCTRFPTRASSCVTRSTLSFPASPSASPASRPASPRRSTRGRR